ncbi:hypothetical protein QUC31_006399 [Theobroma cacao]
MVSINSMFIFCHVLEFGITVEELQHSDDAGPKGSILCKMSTYILLTPISQEGLILVMLKNINANNDILIALYFFLFFH